MKRLPRLDLLAGAPRPWRGWVALGASLVLLVASVHAMWPAHLQARAVAAPAAPAVPAAPLPSSAWTPYFALQTEHGRGAVRLLVVEPGASADALALQGEAPDLPSLLRWLHELRGDPRLSDVELARHEQRDELLGSPVRFSVQARWRQSSVDPAAVSGARIPRHPSAAVPSTRESVQALPAPPLAHAG